MKTKTIKLFAVLFVTLFVCANVLAREGVAKHGLIVKRLRNWAPSYLTVIDNYENLNFENAPSTLRFLSVITSVNGNSTEYMDENEFHRIIDQPGEVELTYMTKLNGENKCFTSKLVRRKGFAAYYVSRCTAPGYSDNLYDFEFAQRPTYPRQYTPTMITDEDIDFFEFCTFDYAYGDENEELEKKAMLRKFAHRLEEKGLKRNTENPDLYIYVTCDLDRSIETVYHPTVKSNTNSHYSGGYGSHGNTWVGSNFISYSSHGSGQVTGQSTTVTSETGRIESYQTNDVYMQLSVLDAKRVGNRSVPKVWQFTANQRYDQMINAKEFERFADILGINYPFGTDNKGHGIVYWKKIADLGIFLYPYSADAQINYVVPGSWAEGLGIKPNSKVMYKFSKWENVFEYYRGDLRSFSSDYSRYDIIKINGKTVKNIQFPPEKPQYYYIDPYVFN